MSLSRYASAGYPGKERTNSAFEIIATYGNLLIVDDDGKRKQYIRDTKGEGFGLIVDGQRYIEDKNNR